MRAVNPATEEEIKTYEEHSDEEVERIISRAEEAWRSWRTSSFAERKRLMLRAAALLRERKEEYARLMTQEMGKPIVQSRSEVEKCAWVCEYYAEEAEELLADEEAESDGKQAFIRFEPIGLILAVMPWNFPFWQVFRFAAPTLMAGNGALLKHASNVPGCALAIEELFREAGFPEHLFRTLLIGSRQVERVVRHDAVRAATLTGSEKAGSLVASQAGSEIKHVVLELGGSDPFIILDDVNVEYCATQAVKGRMINTGQSCIAAKRFIVHEEVYDDFLAKYTEFFANQKTGDPMDEEVNVGPLARREFVDDLHSLVTDAAKKGAEVIVGGAPAEGAGFYYPPTIVAGITPEMRLFHEESFGPLASVYKVQDEKEAVSIANATRFGLGASVWSKDEARALAVAEQVEAGTVFINGIVKSDPRLPFGGVKKSGYGRELGAYGIKEFCNVKTYWIGQSASKTE